MNRARLQAFHDLADLEPDTVAGLIGLARQLERQPEPQALAGRVLALLFLSPSLRTLSSFQAGMARLGGNAFVISPEMAIHGLEFRDGVVMNGRAAEHVREAIPVLSSYGDALGIRVFAERRSLAEDLADTRYRSLAALSHAPVINMESAINHPCQSLADWKTMDELDVPGPGGRFVLSWAYHPRALPLAVPAATLHMAAMRGMQVTVLRPKGFELPGAVMDRAHAAAERAGGSVRETDDREAGLEGAQILYAKSWTSPSHYGDTQAETELRARHQDWCVQPSWFEPAEPDCRFMHCLPVRRNVVVSDAVLDGPRSVVIHQARNRMYAQMAILHQMLGNS